MNRLSACFRRSIPLLAFGLGHLACAVQRGEFEQQMEAGEKARRQKDLSAEQASFERAAAAAVDDDERAEAHYRAAHALLRAGKIEQGAMRLEQLAQRYPHSARAARAWLDAGRSWEKLGRSEQATHAYETVWLKYPDSGAAITAAKRTVQLQPGDNDSLKWEGVLTKNRSLALRPALLYQLGLSLEATSPPEAITAFQEVAKLEPLPGGAYTDDALLRAALLRRAAGDFQGALETLKLLIPHGGNAVIVGSYNRSAYVESLLLQGRILRDDLANISDAKEAFLKLPERFPDSRLVDDALWEVAVTDYRARGNGCDAIHRLRETRPHSSLLRCSPTLCPDSKQPVPTDCDDQQRR